MTSFSHRHATAERGVILVNHATRLQFLANTLAILALPHS